MRTSNAEVIIFSADREGREELLNIEARTDLECMMHSDGIFFERVTGCYEGTIENSYMVSAKYLEVVKGYAKLFNQESILVLDHERQASLVYTDGTLVNFKDYVKLGTFKPVSESMAKANIAWTYSPKLNQYYMAL